MSFKCNFDLMETWFQNLDRELTKLALWVYNEWKGQVRIQITKAWQRNCQKIMLEVLHCEGRAVDIQLYHNYDPETYGLVAGMATKSGFHFVKRETPFSIHLSIGYGNYTKQCIIHVKQQIACNNPFCYMQYSTINLLVLKQKKVLRLAFWQNLRVFDQRV